MHDLRRSGLRIAHALQQHVAREGRASWFEDPAERRPRGAAAAAGGVDDERDLGGEVRLFFDGGVGQDDGAAGCGGEVATRWG